MYHKENGRMSLKRGMHNIAISLIYQEHTQPSKNKHVTLYAHMKVDGEKDYRAIRIQLE